MKAGLFLSFAMLFSINFIHTAADNNPAQVNPNRERAEFAAGLLIGMFAKEGARLIGIPGADTAADIVTRSISIERTIPFLHSNSHVLKYIKCFALFTHELATPLLVNLHKVDYVKPFLYDAYFIFAAIICITRWPTLFQLNQNIRKGITIGYEMRRMYDATQTSSIIEKKITFENFMSIYLFICSIMRAGVAIHRF